MNSKKAGLAFLLLVVLQCMVTVAMIIYCWVNPYAEDMGIVTNLILSEIMIVIPIVAVALLGKRNEKTGDLFGFRKIKISTALMTVLFTILIMPLATFFNAISMLFVDNTVATMTGDILDVPFFVMFLLMAVYGPFCEELTFRGVIYRSFRKSGNIFGAILLSALLFGLMHMNFNQAGYAIALGIMMALLAEATGSTTASFICHMVFNGETVCMMFLEKYLYTPEMLEEMWNTSYSQEEMLASVSVVMVVALIGTALAMCVLAWIAENEGKQNFFRTIWESRKNHRERLWTFPVILGVMIAIAYMLWSFLFLGV